MKRVVLLGNTGNGIFHQMVHHFLNNNTQVIVIDGTFNYSHDNLVQISAKDYLRAMDRVLLMVVPNIISQLDTVFTILYLCLSFQFKRLKEFRSLPSLKQPIANMLTYSRVLNHVRFDYALCLNVYFFGLPALLSKSRKFIAQPWGGDVNRYGISSPLRFLFMTQCLKSMDYIAPAGRSVIPFMIEKYKIDKSKFVFLPPTVDKNLFQIIPDAERVKRRKEMKISSNAVVFFSCRRFSEGWGPHIVKELFIKLSHEIPNSFFIVLSGYDSNDLIDQFKSELPDSRKDQFLFLDKVIPLEEFSFYSQIADFTVSAMTNRDMQSSSIMQSVACGAYPMLLEQLEYKIMVNEGFSSIMFNEIDDNLIQEVKGLIQEPNVFHDKKSLNKDYFIKRETNKDYVTILNSLQFNTLVFLIVQSFY
ncbi:MAG: hypothetical protein ABI663_11675 [Chryseolinea sp.]